MYKLRDASVLGNAVVSGLSTGNKIWSREGGEFGEFGEEMS